MLNDIIKNLNSYLEIFNEENHLFEKLKNQISEEQDLLSRSNFNGHVTASALIINSNNEILVIFHNKLQKYLQPGGHVEVGDIYLEDSARREVLEETGISNIELHKWCLDNKCPILVDTHIIPENIKKNESEHSHHDFMFVYKVDSSDVILDENEVSDYKWVSFEDVMSGTDSNVARALKKMKNLDIL
jgi:8-oxo-dGTP pyrophosphatase MutT (NUDIX family)